MKGRVIDTLKSFASKSILKEKNVMFSILCEELKLTPEALHIKSKLLLNSIVKNYATFDISTIDKFTQKIIRTFAFDLKLPMNFEVELDTDTLLQEAVDNLIANAGNDKSFTKILVDFTIEKADDDKSWDIAYDFNKIAKLLVSENDIPFIEKLKHKSLEDFKSLKENLSKQILVFENQIVSTAKKVLTLIDECGLEHNDFSSSYLPKHFINLSNKKFYINFEANWQVDIESKTLYPKRVTEGISEIIENIQPELAKHYNETKVQVFRVKFLKDFYKNITPLSVLNAIQKEVDILKQDRNLILISEFNSIINKEIRDQPIPFIYERIGEKFRHYFIDEFQDTSNLQWANLIPLLDNSLSGENSSVTLVGDAKQAIYRWRGGKAEQFIELYQGNTPFYSTPSIYPLEYNYRSYSEIVSFNNSFFKHLSEFVFSNNDYKELYVDCLQKIQKNNAGYVNLNFLDINKSDDKDELYTHQVLKTIETCISNGFQPKDICILTRSRKDGVTIADYLTSDAGLDVISSETLLLSNAPEINFIINLLSFLLRPNDDQLKIKWLQYLANHQLNVEDKHSFYNKHIHLKTKALFKALEEYHIIFDFEKVLKVSIYEVIEIIIQSFNLIRTSNAYIQFFLDFTFEYSQKYNYGWLHFLQHYEDKKHALSILSTQENNAVQIMTIHKSKGLEFPVIIFPYADLDIYKAPDKKLWLPINSDQYNDFTNAFLNYSKNVQHYGEVGFEAFKEHQSELELDNINLLYVTLTRAIEQLYIITIKASKVNTNLFSGLFISFLNHLGLWDNEKTSFEFGSSKRVSNPKLGSKDVRCQEKFFVNTLSNKNIKVVTKSGLLWDTKQEEAIEKGNLTHYIMSKIKTSLDIEITFNSLLHSGEINAEQMPVLKQLVLDIVNHPKLKSYFNSEAEVYCEREIITDKGILLRPDRLVINKDKNEVVILDYKTGSSHAKHQQQLKVYQEALEAMNYHVASKI